MWSGMQPQERDKEYGRRDDDSVVGRFIPLETGMDCFTHPDMNLEARTVEAMIRMYCRDHHGPSAEICSHCAELLAYALQRIEKCPFGKDKPACSKCTVHCYAPDRRERIRTVMRYAGPRMILRHPILAVRHLIRSRRYSGIRSK